MSFSLFHFPACSPGMYKAGLRNTQCQNCPANSTVVGAVTCNCTRGHYRMNGEGATDPCTSKLNLLVCCFSFIAQCVTSKFVYIVCLTYRNSLFFRCINIFVHRKCMKFFYVNIILQRKFLRHWFVPCYTQALPQLLLPIYPCIPGSL